MVSRPFDGLPWRGVLASRSKAGRHVSLALAALASIAEGHTSTASQSLTMTFLESRQNP